MYFISSIFRKRSNHNGGLITTFEIPKKMTKFSPQILFGNTSLSELKVASGNTAFIAEDGVLYTKDKSTLVLFPVDKAVTQFTGPTGVKQIGFFQDP